MSVTAGFFNSYNHDRTYNSKDLNDFLASLINNGVFANVGDGLIVNGESPTVGDSGFFGVTVGTGKAFLDGFWIKNDYINKIQIDRSRFDPSVTDIGLHSIVEILIYNDREVYIVLREGEFGEQSDTSKRPPLYRAGDSWATFRTLPLAWVWTTYYRPYIDNLIGTDVCPWVTGILSVISAEAIYSKWNREWNEFVAENEATAEELMNDLTDYTNQWNAFYTGAQEDYEEFKSTAVEQTKVAVESDTVFRNDVANATKTLVTADAAFKSELVSSTKTQVVNDSTFKSEIKTEVESDTIFKQSIVNDIKSDSTFQSDISSATETLLAADSTFKSDVASDLSSDSGFVSDVKDGVIADDSFKSDVKDDIVADTQFRETVQDAVEANIQNDSEFKQDLVDDTKIQLTGDTAFKESLSNYLATDEPFKSDVTDAVEAAVMSGFNVIDGVLYFPTAGNGG